MTSQNPFLHICHSFFYQNEICLWVLSFPSFRITAFATSTAETFEFSYRKHYCCQTVTWQKILREHESSIFYYCRECTEADTYVTEGAYRKWVRKDQEVRKMRKQRLKTKLQKRKNISLKKMVLLMYEKLGYICQYCFKACCKQHCFGLAQVRPTSSDLTKLGFKLCCTCIYGESISRAVQHPNRTPPLLHSLVPKLPQLLRKYMLRYLMYLRHLRKKTMQKCSKSNTQANEHPQATCVYINTVWNQDLTLMRTGEKHSLHTAFWLMLPLLSCIL